MFVGICKELEEYYLILLRQLQAFAKAVPRQES